MSNDFCQAMFDSCVHSEFQIIENEAPVCTLELTDILARTKTPGQEAFSLMFQGPAEPFVPQGVRRLKHGTLGELDLFLVPVGKENDGFQYEAVFNLLLQPRE